MFEAFILIHSPATFALSSMPALSCKQESTTAFAPAQQRVTYDTGHFPEGGFDIGYTLFQHLKKLLGAGTRVGSYKRMRS